MSYSDNRPLTIICDIDGTLVKHMPPHIACNPLSKMTILPGSIEKLSEWERSGYNIILLTGRKESMRSVTENQLKDVGIFYDQLIMGVGGGARYLINDTKPEGTLSAYAINVIRDLGIKDVEL